eukprot:COSAG06_NODE_666_length_13272_cov_10.674334_5_plen_69_part_00
MRHPAAFALDRVDVPGHEIEVRGRARVDDGGEYTPHAREPDPRLIVHCSVRKAGRQSGRQAGRQQKAR